MLQVSDHTPHATVYSFEHTRSGATSCQDELFVQWSRNRSAPRWGLAHAVAVVVVTILAGCSAPHSLSTIGDPAKAGRGPTSGPLRVTVLGSGPLSAPYNGLPHTAAPGHPPPRVSLSTVEAETFWVELANVGKHPIVVDLHWSSYRLRFYDAQRRPLPEILDPSNERVRSDPSLATSNPNLLIVLEPGQRDETALGLWPYQLRATAGFAYVDCVLALPTSQYAQKVSPALARRRDLEYLGGYAISPELKILLTR
jgi:hypothetical protein